MFQGGRWNNCRNGSAPNALLPLCLDVLSTWNTLSGLVASCSKAVLRSGLELPPQRLQLVKPDGSLLSFADDDKDIKCLLDVS